MQRITQTSKSGVASSTNSSVAAAAQQGFEHTIHFSQAQAIVWQIKFILNQISNKKALASAASEIESLSAKFGKDFDKYLLRELIDQIDLKDPVKAQKDKNEPFKITLLIQELQRCIAKSDFLQYFGDVAQATGFSDRLGDFITELTKRLKLGLTNQILIALSLVESIREESQAEAIKILKQKLSDYMLQGRPEPFPDYALHRLIFLLSTHPDMIQDENRDAIKQYLTDSNTPLKSTSHISLRCALQQDLMHANTEEPSYNLFKEGYGIDNLDKSYKMLEPWQLLVDLGHFSSYNYNYLLKTLEDFKDINEKGMARTLLQLSIHHTGCDDVASKIAQNTFEANKKGDSAILRKEIVDKKNSMSWSIDNLVRAFRELYSHLKWAEVFESLSQIPDDVALDSKAFLMFLSITNKSKPQNLPYPLQQILQTQWASPLLQLSFIENSIQFYTEKKEKSINFHKAGDRRQEVIEELTGIREKVSQEFLHVWLSVDLVERLIVLSDSHYFHRVRHLFEAPLKQVPEYLLLTLSLCKPTKGNLMIDELLSLLMPQFLGNHINSILVLQALWKNNQALMIRAICELCRHEQRIMNLSRVLDITQEVKDSLMPIVDCEDYYFAVNLAILAGKRDFLHYDMWLQKRINEVGTPFIKALLKYVKENVITPIVEFQRRSGTTSPAAEIISTQEQLEQHKVQVLERSHLNKDKLCFTIENLQDQRNQTNQLIRIETREQIREVVSKLNELFPNQFNPTQSSEEIDNAANEHFQRVFSAEGLQIDIRISELIDTMQRFRISEIKKEQEIYACMLHSLFDEYRFLHKYPTQYLEKIAKLFGAIIKNKIMDGTLQEIALKFVLEAFRREGKRMRFGIIVIRHIIDMLPQFQQFFDGIYELRHNIAAGVPQDASNTQLIKDIEELYERTMKGRVRAPLGAISTSDEGSAIGKLAEEAKSNLKGLTDISSFIDDQSKIGSLKQEVQDSSLHKIDGGSFLKTFQQAQAPTQAPPTKKEIKQQKEKGGSSLTPSSTQAAPFNPTYKVRGTTQQLAGSQSQTSNEIPSGQGLNPSSDIYVYRPTVPPTGLTPQPSQALGMTQSAPVMSGFQGMPQQNQAPSIVNARPFIPANTRSPAPPVGMANFPPQQQQMPIIPIPQQPPINQHTLALQKTIEAKLQKAISENAKVRLEDVIEDSNMLGPNSDQQEEIKFICNNTGKTNFPQKLEQLKGVIAQNPQVNLPWFVHFILTKRLSSQSFNLFPIYIDLIRQLGQKDAISLTISQIVEIFKKCMLIDEDLLNRVTQRAQNQNASQLIKMYLSNLGSFLGLLTVAINRPIYAKELDVKQLLVEGFQSEKMKTVTTFVCRILKECPKSSIFKHQNPWVRANLEILREIYDRAVQSNTQAGQPNQHQDIIMEIEGLFRVFSIQSLNDIQNTGFINASITQQYTSSSQRVELMHFQSKPKLIPTFQNPIVEQQVVYQQQQRAPIQQQQMLNPYDGGPYDNVKMITDMQKIYQKVVISMEFLGLLGIPPGSLQQHQDQILRKVAAEAVEQSIIEILPPVVDRSVTIALITTRELVLKDFAFDADYTKILKAADLIVQNLAGSLALVTCREPLKMQLTTNLKKFLEQQMNHAQFPDGGIDEQLFSKLAQQASQDNIELGCKLIKKAVIQKALTKVRQDPQIMRAIEIRQNHKEFKASIMHDEAMLSQFADLPNQLKPNVDGLTDAQFQVYEDFDRLSNQSMQVMSANNEKYGKEYQPIGDLPEPSEDIEVYLKQYESQPNFDKKFEQHFGAKIVYMNSRQDQVEQIKKLQKYCENIFFPLCEKIAAQQQNMVIHESTLKVLDFLSFVTAQALRLPHNEDLRTILTQKFLSLDSSFVYNTILSLHLMRRAIISTSKWDSQIATFVRDNQQYTSSVLNSITKEIEGLFSFLRDFFDAAVQNPSKYNISEGGQRLSYHHFQNVILVIQKLSETDPSIGQFFAQLLQDYRQRTVWTKENLKEYFNEWAIISFEEASNPALQEQEVGRFFENLKSQGLYKDPKAVNKFCKTMLELSVNRALYLSDGVTKRPLDRLVYRYIEIFLNLLYVSLIQFISGTEGMNKIEFLQQVFDAIHQVLEEDHKTKRGDFNQKPYYRILINILRVVNNTDILNQKQHLQVLISLSELFNKLNPKEYPAFSFAWLELISHKLFMPYFLQALPQPQAAQQQVIAQARKPGQAQQPGQEIQNSDSTFYQKQFMYKDLILHLFTFLKSNMLIGQPLSEPLAKFYEATLRVVLVIKSDYPEFLCDFHFNFVNALPEQCIQLKNIILSAQPRQIPVIDPFSRHLKVDTLPEIQMPPRDQSNYENYLEVMSLREDLDKYFRTKDPSLIHVIADKLMQCEEIINGRKRINSNIFNAVALFIHSYAHKSKTRTQAQKECYDMLKQVLHLLNSETRHCLMSSIINELRYVNALTYFYSWMVIYMFNDNDESVQELITRILIERLQTHEPHPWGLCITFRELLQNPKYNFTKKSYVLQNQTVIDQLMQTKLQNFQQFWVHNKVNQQTQQHQ